MAHVICYYTGTGNSLWAARTLASAVGGTDLASIPASRKENKTIPQSSTVGLVFPVHIWGLPRTVRNFLGTVAESKPEYCYAVAVNAGQVSNTLVQLRRELREKGSDLSSGFALVMPSNYIPWGGPGSKEKQEARFAAARSKLSAIAETIRKKEVRPVEKGPLWQRVLFTGIYDMSYPRVPEMDKSFRADEKCNQCGICVRVCPADNITLPDGKPVWNRRCEQCFACLQWCPREAIQYGKKTPGYERYRHPEVTLKDMIGD
ncbi:MAG: EFR1 family ferrodoxin [bacterium]|nr:EFR1 family ferrodoxin [bacterium]